MSLNLGHALAGGHITKSMGSDFICDPDRGFQGNHVNPLSAIKNASTSLLMLYICKHYEGHPIKNETFSIAQ